MLTIYWTHLGGGFSFLTDLFIIYFIFTPHIYIHKVILLKLFQNIPFSEYFQRIYIKSLLKRDLNREISYKFFIQNFYLFEGLGSKGCFGRPVIGSPNKFTKYSCTGDFNISQIFSRKFRGFFSQIS